MSPSMSRGPDDAPRPESSTDAASTTPAAGEEGTAEPTTPAPATSPESAGATATPRPDDSSDAHQGDLSLSGRPIDDGPVTGALEPGHAPSTPGEPAPLPPHATADERVVPAPDAGTGQHAAARPYPPAVPADARRGAGTSGTTAAGTMPPDAAPDTAPTTTAPTTTAPTTTAPTTGAPVTGTPVTAVAPAATGPASEHPTSSAAAPAAAGLAAGAAASRRDLRERDESTDRVPHEDLPARPRKPGFGRHLLGALLGFLLTPVALLLVGIGTSRLSDVAGSGDPASDALGLTLLVLGAVLLGVIVLLGAWSPLVPLTGGIVWGLGLGIAYLVVPGLMQDTVDPVVEDRVLPAVVEQLTESAMSGQLVVTGSLLVAAGIAAGRARRSGRRWAEAVAVAEQARAEATRADAARDAARTAEQRPTS